MNSNDQKSPNDVFSILSFLIRSAALVLRSSVWSQKATTQFRRTSQCVRGDSSIPSGIVSIGVANDPSIFTITEKAPTKGFSW